MNGDSLGESLTKAAGALIIGGVLGHHGAKILGVFGEVATAAAGAFGGAASDSGIDAMKAGKDKMDELFNKPPVEVGMDDDKDGIPTPWDPDDKDPKKPSRCQL